MTTNVCQPLRNKGKYNYGSNYMNTTVDMHAMHQALATAAETVHKTPLIQVLLDLLNLLPELDAALDANPMLFFPAHKKYKSRRKRDKALRDSFSSRLWVVYKSLDKINDLYDQSVASRVQFHVDTLVDNLVRTREPYTSLENEYDHRMHWMMQETKQEVKLCMYDALVALQKELCASHGSSVMLNGQRYDLEKMHRRIQVGTGHGYYAGKTYKNQLTVPHTGRELTIHEIANIMKRIDPRLRHYNDEKIAAGVHRALAKRKLV